MSNEFKNDGLEVSSNGIIFNLKYHKKFDANFNPKNDVEEKLFNTSKWYRSSQSISYILRDSACDYMEEDEALMLDNLTNYTNVPKDEIKRNIDKELNNNRINGFGSDGDLTDEKILELEKKIKNTDSTIWSSVISFTPEYSNQFCYNRLMAKDLMNHIANDFFRSCKLNPNNITWYASFHNNTPEHNHIHFVFFENEPKIYDSKGNLKYSKSYLPKRSLEKTIGKIYEYHHQPDKSYCSIRDEIRNKIKSSYKEDYFQTIMKNLSEELKDISSYQYGNLSNENKLKVNNSFMEILKNNSMLKKQYNTYITKLHEHQRKLIEIWQVGNPKSSMKFLPPNIRDFANSRVKELYIRCGNTILSNLKVWNKNKKERQIYNNRLKNKKYNPFANHNNCRSASYTRISNSKLARQLKNSCIGLLQQDQSEAINYLFDRSIKEFYDKLMKEELEAKLELQKIKASTEIDRD